MDGKKIFDYFIKGLFWSLVVFLIVPAFLWNLLSVYNNFLISSIAYTLDTLFLNWNTTFPAVTICEIYNGERNWDVSENYFGVDRDHRIDDFVGEITFFSGTCRSCYKCDNMSCPLNFNELALQFRSSCEKLLTNCTWLGITFNCCDEFRPLVTEYGNCFSFNSMQAGNTSLEYNYNNNRETGPGQLQFLIHEDVQINVHPTNEIPFLLSEGVIRETVLWGSRKEIIFSIMEIFNDPSVFGYSVNSRKCRFEYEQIDGHSMYRLYSYSSCIVECVKSLQMAACNCHFFMLTGNKSICDVNGLKCLSEHFINITEQRRQCTCLSSCEEPEIHIVYSSTEDSNQESQEPSVITISLVGLPTQRYVRKEAKSFLDLIISVGGIAGLFFGASVISIIEIFYQIYIAFKRLCTAQCKKFKSTKLNAINQKNNPIKVKSNKISSKKLNF